jgi:small-conductance mechanosensitive channel
MDITKFFARPFMHAQFLGHSVGNYLVCLLTIIAGLAVVWILDRLVLRWIGHLTRHTETTLDDFMVNTVQKHALPALYAIVIFLGLRGLNLKPSMIHGLRAAVIVLAAVQGVRMAVSIAQELLEREMARRSGAESAGEQEKKSVRGILVLVKMVTWGLAFILVLDNLGVKVSTFVAGLGITGIAVALAAQAILGDLFSYFVIFFDRPFQVGHAIKVGNFMGQVESIGIKTTRLRSLSGEQVVMSNKYLTDNQVQNFKVMSRRRALLLFEVEYKTPESKLRSIPATIREIVSAFPDATYDRAHFKEFGESGLRFEAAFFVEDSDYRRFLDVVQEVNLGIKARFESQGITFAHPARTVQIIQA